jgi:hypothetical protein
MSMLLAIIRMAARLLDPTVSFHPTTLFYPSLHLHALLRLQLRLRDQDDGEGDIEGVDRMSLEE